MSVITKAITISAHVTISIVVALHVHEQRILARAIQLLSLLLFKILIETEPVRLVSAVLYALYSVVVTRTSPRS